MPEGDDDNQVGVERGEFVDDGTRFDFGRLNHAQIIFLGENFYGRRLKFVTAAFWFVGLSDDANHFGLVDERGETRHGKIGRAHEDDF